MQHLILPDSEDRNFFLIKKRLQELQKLEKTKIEKIGSLKEDLEKRAGLLSLQNFRKFIEFYK